MTLARSFTAALLSAALAGPLAAQDAEPVFVEVAARRGLPTEGLFHRNVLCDVDGDGWVDALLHNERLFLNRPDPRGGRRFEEAPLLGEGAPRADLLLVADLDGDGARDLMVGYGEAKEMPGRYAEGRASHVRLQQRGEATRFPAPREAPPLIPAETLVAGALLDYDGDGVLDLVTGAHYVTGGLELEAYPLHLLRGKGDGTFEERTEAAGLALRREPGEPDSRRPVYGLATYDVDGDGWTDVLVCAYGRQRNLLYLNQRDGTFREVGQASGFAGDEDQSGTYPESTKRMFRERFGVEREDELPFRANGNTFDAPCGDYDNDGDLDLFLGEITHAWAGSSSDRSSVLENLGASPLRFARHPDAAARRHASASWNQGDLYAGWLDVDNDGWLDLLIASGDYPDEQRLRLFRQVAPGRFEDATGWAGLDWLNCTQLSLADYDRDGDVDILVGNSHMRLTPEQRQAQPLRIALFENRLGQRNHWLNVRLVGRGPGRGANRDAIGARVRVTAGGLTQTRVIAGGLGHAGHNDALEAAFGLGRAERIERLEVRWPGPAGTQVFEDLPVDTSLVIREGEPTLRVHGPR